MGEKFRKECFLCWKALKNGTPEENNKIKNQTHVYQFNSKQIDSCKKYIELEVWERCKKKGANNILWTDKSFCFACFEASETLTVIHEVWTDVQKQLNDTVDSFKQQILSERCRKLTSSPEDDECSINDCFSDGGEHNDDFSDKDERNNNCDQPPSKIRLKRQNSSANSDLTPNTKIQILDTPKKKGRFESQKEIKELDVSKLKTVKAAKSNPGFSKEIRICLEDIYCKDSTKIRPVKTNPPSDYSDVAKTIKDCATGNFTSREEIDHLVIKPGNKDGRKITDEDIEIKEEELPLENYVTEVTLPDPFVNTGSSSLNSNLAKEVDDKVSAPAIVPIKNSAPPKEIGSGGHCKRKAAAKATEIIKASSAIDDEHSEHQNSSNSDTDDDHDYQTDNFDVDHGSDDDHYKSEEDKQNGSKPMKTAVKKPVRKKRRRSLTPENSKDGDDETYKMKCEVCYQIYYTEISFRKHLYRHKNPKYCKNPIEFKEDREIASRLLAQLRLNKKLQSQMEESNSESKSFVFECEKCPRKYQTKYALVLHQTRDKDCNSTTTKHPYNPEQNKRICKICGVFQVHLKRHMIRQHSQEKPYQCDKCDESFKSLEKYNEHIKCHITEFNFACDPCPEKFKIVQDLNAHQKEHEKEDWKKSLDKGTYYECNICSDTFKKPASLNLFLMHMIAHKVHKCKFCGEQCDSKKSLEEHHIEKHKGEYPCHICTNTFKTHAGLRSHLSYNHGKNERYFCEDCGVSFQKRTNLTSHRSEKHPHEGEEKTFKCDKENCGKAFYTKAFLMTHLKRNHKSSQCEICGTSTRNLAQHMLSHNETPFECDVCGKQFKRKDKMAQHKKAIHEGQKKECNVCGRKFNSAQTRQTHMRTHTGEKPYECSACSKCFDRPHNLKTHMRLHTGEKPYKCDKCGKQVSRKDNLNTHVKKCQGLE